MMELVPLKEEERGRDQRARLPSSLSVSVCVCVCVCVRVDTQQEDSCLQSKKRVFTRDRIHRHLDLGLDGLQVCEK